MVLEVRFKVVSLLFWALRILCLFIDGHPPARVILFPHSLLQRFQEATMGITLFYLFHLFLALWWIATGGVLHIWILAGDESCMAGDVGDVFSWRQRCLVWSGMDMF